MDLRLTDRVVLITGGAGGIGRGCARIFSEEGARIVLMDIDAQKAAETAAELQQEFGATVLVVQTDVTDVNAVEAGFDEVLKTFPRVDVLVNNAAIFVERKPIDMETDEDWMRCIAGSVHHSFYTTRRFVKECKAKKQGGHILNVSAKSVFHTVSKGNTAYITAKGALVAMTRNLADQLLDFGIYVNCILPGYVRNSVYADGAAMTAEKAPHARLGFADPEDIGSLVAFLCSQRAKQITGAIVDCSGGTMF